MIKELFQTVFQNYLPDKAKFNNESVPRSTGNLISAKTLTQKLPNELRIRLSTLTHNYLIKGSVGFGEMPEIAHICFFDKDITISSQNGYFLAYLFDSKMTKMYLSLLQGWTQLKKSYGIVEARDRVIKNATLVREFLSTVDGLDFIKVNLNATGDLGRGYEVCNICSKLYDAKNLPDDSVLIADLKNMLSVYNKIKISRILKNRNPE